MSKNLYLILLLTYIDMMEMKRQKLGEMKKKRSGQFCQSMVDQDVPESVITIMKTALQAVQDQEIDQDLGEEFDD